MKPFFNRFLLLGFLLIFTVTPAMAVPITSLPGESGLGSFVGDFSYNPGTAQIVVSLTNTSPAANGGYLVAFAFNNPGNAISGVSFASSSANFGLIGDPTFDNSIPASPYGDFDIGSASSASWLGGGSPTGGIAVGDTETFTFDLTGTGLGSLTTGDFFNTLSEGSASNQEQWFAARFRGFEDGGSDKVPGTPVPEPATLLLVGLGLFGLVGMGRKKKIK